MPDLNKNQVPRLARWMLNRMIIYKMNHSVIDDFDETYREVLEVKGVFRARIWYWRDVLKSMPEYIQFITSWRILMLSNYLKIAYRHFISHKLFSFINVFGLALGLSICTIISLWVQREMSYDSFHDKADRIYRVERELFRDHAYSRWPITNALYKQALVDDYPEITHAVRLWRREMALTDYKDLSHNQELYMTDNSIFDVFSFGLEEGDPKTALVEPNSMVLTRELAIRYFGTEDVVGQTRTFEQGENSVDFKVTGILAPVPENSHIHFDMLVSYSTIPVNPNMSWRGNNLYTYILTREGVSGQELEARMFEFIEKHLEVAYQGLISQGLGIHDVLKMHLFPITNIHLNPAENWEMEIGGSQTSVYIFSIVAILILLIACINFINLSTARAKKRAREVSLRKTVGADRNQLKWQFIQESMLLAFTALLIAFMMATMLIPVFQRLFDEHLTLALLFNVKTICLLFGATALVGILAGLYPAFYLTRFEPAFILRGMGTVGKGQSAFRRNMVIIQFGISIVLIIGMLTVHRQMQYIQRRSLGYIKEGVMLVSVESRQVIENYETLRNNLLQSNRVLSVSASSDVPGEAFFSNIGFTSRDNPDDVMNLLILGTQYDFVETYQMELAAGRVFAREFATDTVGTLMLNEMAVKRAGWTVEEAIGKELGYNRVFRARVVGVVKDFHLKSLHTVVEPLAIMLNNRWINSVAIRIQMDNVSESINYVQQKWEDTFPGEQFEFSFLDQNIQRLYDREVKMQNIFIVFSGLSVFVACLGLLGLAAFTAEVKTKEIGIRKALGATALNVTLLLTKDFVRWVILANIAAWPLAWYLMNKWLQNFAYQTSLEWPLFLFAAIIALVIAILTFSYQALKAAVVNPVESLKHE